MSTLKIGLTGGVASGKSTVADMFKQLGIDVFDADVIAKQLVENDLAIQKKMLSFFGTLDRKKIRSLIFNDFNQKKWLEKLLHPKIIEQLKTLSDESKSDYCVLVIPLLFEAKCESLVDYIVTIDADEALQTQRLKQRDNIDDALIDSMLKAQVSRIERRKKADFVIENDKNLAHLSEQVQKLHQKFIDFCASK